MMMMKLMRLLQPVIVLVEAAAGEELEMAPTLHSF